MSGKNSDPSELETRNRLLNAAGEVFAEKGFKSATVRSICHRAGANVAAINYHFGDKRKLYAQVLRFSHACALKRHPPDSGISDQSTPQQRLRAFIHSFLQRVFDDGRPAWHSKLMSREMVEPTGALDYLVRHEIQPQREGLTQMLRQLMGPRANQKLLRHCVQSIVGQCVFYHHGRPVVQLLYPEQKFDRQGVDERAEYIYRFTLAALNGLASDLAAAKRRNNPGKKGRQR